MAPIIFQLQTCPWAELFLINTAQHRSLLDNLLTMYHLTPDADLDIMTHDQSLGELTGNLCKKFETLIKNNSFDVLLAVGDTTTVMVASLIAFYHKIPFGHIEAGLRTSDVYEPFPEEINRVLTTPLATWHFAPTKVEQDNLLRENIDASKIIVTGNTVIDSLYWVLKNNPGTGLLPNMENIVLVTTHRRENFGVNLEQICLALIELSNEFKDLNFVLPVHPNPNVKKKVEALLKTHPQIHLLEPLPYNEFAALMNRSLFILTDSGGVQEEAPALGKPVLVLRNTTERPAIISEGLGLLVGTKKENIVKAVKQLLNDKTTYAAMSRGVSPYGDGHAAERIINSLKQSLGIQ